MSKLILIFSTVFFHFYIPGSEKFTVLDILFPFFTAYLLYHQKFKITSISLVLIMFIWVFGCYSLLSDLSYFAIFKSIIQYSILVLASNILVFQSNQILITERNVHLLLFFINLIGIFHLSIAPQNLYNDFTSLPFQHSVDKAAFYLPILSFFLDKRENFKSRFFVVNIILCLINILFSGSRFSILILIFFGCKLIPKFNVYKTITVLFFFSIVIIYFDDFLSFMLDLGLINFKLYSFFGIFQSFDFLEFIFQDSSFNTRIDNILYVFKSMEFLEVFFGYGSEIWRTLLSSQNIDTALDNSLIVFYFNYGLFGFFFFLFYSKMIYSLGRKYLFYSFFLFSQIQDVFGNFNFMFSFIASSILYSITFRESA